MPLTTATTFRDRRSDTGCFSCGLRRAGGQGETIAGDGRPTAGGSIFPAAANGREPTVNRIEYDGAFWFPVTPDQLWVTVERFDQFESWWRWLRNFRADEAGLVAGNVLHGTVVPPVPYQLRLDVRLQRCCRPRSVDAKIDGDLSGWGMLRLEDANDGTRVAVAWSLEMRSTPLRVAARVAYPLMRWGHDRVVDMAVAGFQRRALSGAASQQAQGSADHRVPRRP